LVATSVRDKVNEMNKKKKQELKKQWLDQHKYNQNDPDDYIILQPYLE